MSSENTANLLMDIGKTILAFSILGYTFAFIMTDINARRYEDMSNLTHRYNRDIIELNSKINELEISNNELPKSIYDSYVKGHDEGYEEGYQEGYPAGYREGYEAGLFENKSECKPEENKCPSIDEPKESYCDSKLISNNNDPENLL